jgi:GNAT superfamily N-acetyltransferase
MIRTLMAADSAAWDELFGEYIAFYKATVPTEVLDLTWERLLYQADGMMGLVAVDADDVPIGLVHLVFHRSTWGRDWYCYLEDLYVSATARGQGVGEALIRATYAEADKRGASRVYWMTEATNATARRVYDRVATLTEYVVYRR